MPDAVIDACCLIDLLASGEAESILRAGGFTWRLPSAVQAEVQYCRQYDPTQPGATIRIPVDLSGLISAGLLSVAHPQSQAELDRFTHYASIFRSDGEAMCLALAEEKQWTMATDDRRAVRIAQQAGMSVVSCPEVIKTWADAMQPDPAALHQVLRNIEVLAQFRPYPSLPHYQWWMDELAKAGP